MITKNPAQPQTSSPAAEDDSPVPVMSPRGPIEVASTGGGTVTDPGGSTKPPGFDDDPYTPVV